MNYSRVWEIGCGSMRLVIPHSLGHVPRHKWTGLVSTLHLNSDTLADAASVSTRDTSRNHDNVPVLAHRGRTKCRARSVAIDRERFTPARHSCREPAPFSWKGSDVGELSLSGEPECLSLTSE